MLSENFNLQRRVTPSFQKEKVCKWFASVRKAGQRFKESDARRLWEAESSGNCLPQERAQQLVTKNQMTSPENIHTGNIMQTEPHV